MLHRVIKVGFLRAAGMVVLNWRCSAVTTGSPKMCTPAVRAVGGDRDELTAHDIVCMFACMFACVCVCVRMCACACVYVWPICPCCVHDGAEEKEADSEAQALGTGWSVISGIRHFLHMCGCYLEEVGEHLDV